MSALLDLAPYGPRDDARLLDELNALTAHHRAGCPDFGRLSANGDGGAASLDALPYVHVGVFKHLNLRTEASDISHRRTLLSSATSTGASPSTERIWSAISIALPSSKVTSNTTSPTAQVPVRASYARGAG